MPSIFPFTPDLGPIFNDDGELAEASSLIGIAVAVSGNIIISLALNCQKLAHKRLERHRQASRNQLNGSSASVTDDEDDARTRVDSDSSQDLSRHDLDDSPETSILLATPTGQRGKRYDGRTTLPRASPLKWKTRDRDAPRIIIQDPTLVVAVPPPPREEEETAKGGYEGRESDYLRSKLWWLGFVLMNVGELGNFISYGFAPASVVAPLGTFALIANCLFAPLMLGEQFRKTDLFGISLAVVGAVTVVLATNQSETRLDPDGLILALSQKPFIFLASVYAIGLVILLSLSERSIGRRVVFIDVGACALFGGFTVLATKGISTLLTLDWQTMFTSWITYPVLAVLIGTGIGQIKYLNRALMKFDSKVVIPTQFVLFNLSAIIGAAVLYGDFRKATLHQMLTFLYGCGTTFTGVFILTWLPTPRKEQRGFGSDIEAVVSAVTGPDGVEIVPLTPKTGRRLTQASSMSLMGLSPAQRALLVLPESPTSARQEWRSGSE